MEPLGCPSTWVGSVSCPATLLLWPCVVHAQRCTVECSCPGRAGASPGTRPPTLAAAAMYLSLGMLVTTRRSVCRRPVAMSRSSILLHGTILVPSPVPWREQKPVRFTSALLSWLTLCLWASSAGEGCLTDSLASHLCGARA
eukprot:scaffold2504_cov405-Prasinococcus_capsulatus_cf.AAC.6